LRQSLFILLLICYNDVCRERSPRRTDYPLHSVNNSIQVHGAPKAAHPTLVYRNVIAGGYRIRPYKYHYKVGSEISLKTTHQLFKWLLIIAAVITSAIQILAGLALLIGNTNPDAYNYAWGLFASAIFLIAGTMIVLAFKKYKFIGLIGAVAGSAVSIVCGSNLTKVMRADNPSAIYIRNHITTLAVPALALICFLIHRAIRRREE